MFKKLLDKMLEAKTATEALEIFGEADMAFQREKISWEDHQRLSKLASIIITVSTRVM